jgi:predicted dienelactone hydrolase
MRPLEIVIPILLVTYLLWKHPRPMIVRLLPAAGLVVTLIHFALEGYRWQMIPLYALTPLLALSSLIKIKGTDDWPMRASILTIGLLLVSTALPILLPVPNIPTPSGSFATGTTTYEFVDAGRKELYSGKDEPRRFMVQVWYPAEMTSNAKHAKWMADPNIYAPAIASFLGLPSFFLDHLALSVSPAYLDVPFAKTDGPSPVILFSHGWNGFNAQNTGQAVELASHGYVVIALQHTYGAVITAFPDGTVAFNNPKALPEDAEDPNYEVVARKLVNQWAEDMSFTLDQFQGFDEDAGSLFFQKLDMNRIGVYGHSTGGGAAIQFCGVDPRCKAVLGMDPFMRPVSAEVIEGGISQPSFFMFSQGWTDLVDSKNNKLFNQFYPHTKNSVGVISINGTKHFDFSDLPLLSPIAPQLGLKGPLNGKRVTRIVNSYLIDFFEMTLNNKPSDLFGGAFDDFSEVKVR